MRAAVSGRNADSWALGRALAIRGVASIDANEEQNRVRIGLADPTVQSRVRTLADSLRIPQGVLVFAVAGYPKPDVDTITGYISALYGDPVVEGGWKIEIVGGGSCTLGAAAIRGTDGDSVFVTASHCTAEEWEYDGASARQPKTNGHTIGTEILDPDADSCNFGATTCRDSDAALFTASVPIRFGKIVRTADSTGSEDFSGSLVVDSIVPSLTITSSAGTVISGEILHKIGKTTGWTYGEVEATCVDFAWPVWPFDDEVKCSDRVDYNSDPGDSGGPVFSLLSGTNVRLRGIHVGGDPITTDGYISNLNQIGIDLGQLTYYDRGAPSVAIQGPTQVPGMGIQCSWQSHVVSGGIPPYTYSWSGLLSGSGGAVSGPIYSSGTLYLTVTDFWGRQGSSSLGVTVVQMPPSCE
jgi:hypothetical protein